METHTDTHLVIKLIHIQEKEKKSQVNPNALPVAPLKDGQGVGGSGRKKS